MKTELQLPAYDEPHDLAMAERLINNLGRNIHEHAYTLGRHLEWVKAQKPSGGFLPWVEARVWFGKRTAQRMMLFTFYCDEADRLLPYEPQKSVTVTLPDPGPLPKGKFRVLLADPPWSYSNSGLAQSAASHYGTMDQDAIMALPVAEAAADDSVLFLWATAPLLPEALQVMGAWGFDYVQNMVWVKDRAPGIGWWTNTFHEHLLMGRRGEPGHPKLRHASVQRGKPREHSRKPELFYGLIERMFAGPYLELFARRAHDGWSYWGNQIEAATDVLRTEREGAGEAVGAGEPKGRQGELESGVRGTVRDPDRLVQSGRRNLPKGQGRRSSERAAG